MGTSRAVAHRRAFALLEAVQGEDPVAAARELDAAAVEAAAWPEVRFVLAAARTVYAIVRPSDGDDVPGLVEELLEVSPEPAALAVALGLKAVVAAGSGDTALLLGCTSRAVALLDDRSLPPMERCLAYVICAAALNTLRLYELVDELYTLAIDDTHASVLAGQAAAVATNRVLVGLEHGLALLEYGDTEAAQVRLVEAEQAVPAALAHKLRPLWRHDVDAVSDLIRLLTGRPLVTPVAQHRVALSAAGDVEVLPLLEAVVALVAWQSDSDPAPAQKLLQRVSSSSGARTFPLWVRATVLADASPAVLAQQDHARLVGRLLWESRVAVLSAARARIASERRRAEHERLSRVVHTDPLTGLHNRRRFDDWLQRPVTGGATALLLIDLDDFKVINDVHGHATGDEVLRRIGMLLRAAVRPGDLALRQGGDEFAIVLQGGELDPQSVLSRAHGIATAVEQEDWEPLAPGLRVSVSVGAALAVVEPGDLVGPALYEAADRALYQAKREGPSQVLAAPVIVEAPGSAGR